MTSGKHCVFAAATGIIYYITRSRNCGLQKISGGSWRFPGGVPPRKHAWLKHCFTARNSEAHKFTNWMPQDSQAECRFQFYWWHK